MQVLGAIDFAEGNTIRDRIRKVSAMVFEDEKGRPCRFTWRTIETWRVRFKRHGITGIAPKARCDKGLRRKMTPEEAFEAIGQVLPLFRGKSYNKAQIYRACLEKGLFRRDRIAPNTFSRMVRDHELLKGDSEASDKKRLAFSKPFANQMWQGDTMHGPHVRNAKGHPRKTYLIGFLDDASRVLAHGEFFFEDTSESLIRTLRAAFYKRGIPEQIYVDNGSAYSSREIMTLCARLGIFLSHAPVRDGAAKGKIERFFRTVRDRFLSRELDLSSLETLNRQFTAWVEEHYNARPHSAIGMKPIDRFGLDLGRIRFLPPNQDNEQLFFLEEDRHVKKDNTFSLMNIRFETPCDLRGRKIQVRFARKDPQKVLVHYKNQCMGEAKALDPIANDRTPAPLKGTRP
jgi:transposase InsO family protein